MATIKLAHFGHLDSDSLDEYYNISTVFQETEIKIDLNFDNKTIDPKRLEVAKQFVENIRIHDLKNKKYIEENYKSNRDNTVKSYLEHHLEELAEDELTDLIDVNSKSADHTNQLLKKLHLIRVGLYPDSSEQFATFDYSIGKELTQYLVVINTDENGNLNYLTMES